MKLNKTISLIIGTTMLLVACEPIENRDVLTNSFDPANIELEVVQSTPGGNELTLLMKTPGIAGYWNYVIGKKSSDRVDVVYPIPGTSTFTFYVTTPYLDNNNINNIRYISKSIDVTITDLDHRLPEPYYFLVGENLEGKSWVFDEDGAFDMPFWGMTADYNWKEFWWQPDNPHDFEGKIVFDLDQGANFTYYDSPSATPVGGTTWSFNPDFSKLTLTGPANLLGSYPDSGGANNGPYQIKELTADRMVLWVPDAEWDTGWLWVFKPES